MNAKLHIRAACRNGSTWLKNVYYTPPLKTADITENKTGKLRLMLMSSSPGILDEDRYELQIELEEKSALVLQTQSYQRLFTMKKHACQQMKVMMAEGSSFHYLPHPVVPHKHSNFSSFNKIYLSSNCTLIWGEVLTCGRKLNGEVFEFTRYQSVTEIYSCGRLAIKENLLLQPAIFPVHSLGQMEGYTHQANMVYLNYNKMPKDLMEAIGTFLSGQQNMGFGITTAPVKGIIIRLLGYQAEQLHHCLITIAENYLN